MQRKEPAEDSASAAGVWQVRQNCSVDPVAEGSELSACAFHLIVCLSDVSGGDEPRGFVLDLCLEGHDLPRVAKDAAPAAVGCAIMTWASCIIAE